MENTLLLNTNALFFAQLIGLFSFIMGASMLLRRTMLTGIFQEMARQRALTYVMGVIMLVMGLLLWLSKDAWGGQINTLMGALGVLVTLEALAFLFLPKRIIARYLALMKKKNLYFLVALAYLVLGLYLIYLGFNVGITL